MLGQSADGLSAAHRAGVVHRDIKPGNLLVRPDGVVKLTDFGIAQARDATPLTRTGMVVGTAQYLSPEQAQGLEVTAASDVYSLGVVAYECLAGGRPFDGASQVAIALAHINRPPPPLPADVPPAVRLLVERALAKDPADRFPDGGAFADAIRRVAAGGTLAPPARTRPGTTPTPVVAGARPVRAAARRPSARPPRAVAAAAARSVTPTPRPGVPCGGRGAGHRRPATGPMPPAAAHPPDEDDWLDDDELPPDEPRPAPLAVARRRASSCCWSSAAVPGSCSATAPRHRQPPATSSSTSQRPPRPTGIYLDPAALHRAPGRRRAGRELTDGRTAGRDPADADAGRAASR